MQQLCGWGAWGTRIQTPGLLPWRAKGSESNMANTRAGKVVEGGGGLVQSWGELPLPWRPAKGGLKISVGEAAVSPGGQPRLQ